MPNMQKPPPPLPASFTPSKREPRFSSTPPLAEAFPAVAVVADPQPFAEPSGLGGPRSREPSPFSPAKAPGGGGYALYDPPGGFDSSAGQFESTLPSGFEEAALQQEQHEKESRGSVGTFSAAGADLAFGMGGGGGEGPGEFEIGTFSIDDVNGAGPGGQGGGRKITRQASTEKAEDGGGGGSGGGGSGGSGSGGGSCGSVHSSDGHNGKGDMSVGQCHGQWM